MSLITFWARLRRRVLLAQFAWCKYARDWGYTSPISIRARIRRDDLRKPAAAVVAFIGVALLIHPWWDALQNTYAPQPAQRPAGTPLRTDTISPAPAPAAAPILPSAVDATANERLRERILQLLAEERLRTGFNAWHEADVLVAAVGKEGAPLRLVNNRPDVWQHAYEAAQPTRMLAVWLLAQADIPCGSLPEDANPSNEFTGTMPGCSLDGAAAWLARIPPARIRHVARQAGLQLPPGRPPHEALLLGEGRMTPQNAALLALRLAVLLTAGRLDNAWDAAAASLPTAASDFSLPSNGGAISAMLSDHQHAVLWALLLDAVAKAQRLISPDARVVMLAVPARAEASAVPRAYVVLIASRDSTPLPQAALNLIEALLWTAHKSVEEEAPS